MKLRIIGLALFALGVSTVALAETLTENPQIQIVVTDSFDTVDAELQTINLSGDELFKITDYRNLPFEYVLDSERPKSFSTVKKTRKSKAPKRQANRARDGL